MPSIDSIKDFQLGPSNFNLLTHGWLLAALLMLFLWWRQWRTRNATLVDVGWAAALGLLALYYANYAGGWTGRKVLVWSLVGIWSLRLTLHLLFNRYLGHPEDRRYQELRRSWGALAQRNFFIFYQAQALLAAILSLPFILALQNRSRGLDVLEFVAVAVWIVGMCGEALADYQLLQFKRLPQSQGKSCRVGLWRYSRHPNYFFEWLIWCSFALLALPADNGWLGLLSPAIMLFLILRVTGIPAAEAQAIQSRGDDYRDYQRTTSAFVPLPPKRQHQAGEAPQQ